MTKIYKKWDKFQCTWCWDIAIYSWVGFEPLEHNIDTWHQNLTQCGRYIYIEKFPEIFSVSKWKKPAIIVDIDWTVANNLHRSPYDMTQLHNDTKHEDIVHLLKTLAESYTILFVTSRKEVYREQTMKWLILNMTFQFQHLYMRKKWDKRNDSIVKYEIAKQIGDKWRVDYVFDDRDRVVQMWREAWFRCLQVQNWNF